MYGVASGGQIGAAALDEAGRSIIIENGPIGEEEFIKKWLEMRG